MQLSLMFLDSLETNKVDDDKIADIEIKYQGFFYFFL